MQGRAPKPDVTLQTSWEDFTHVLAGHTDPRKMLLRRRIKPRGKVRSLIRMNKLFPR